MESSGIHSSTTHLPGMTPVSPDKTKIISKLQMKAEHRPLDPAQVVLSRMRLEPSRLPIVSGMRRLSPERAAKWQSILEGKERGHHVGRLGNRVIAFIEPDEEEEQKQRDN